MQDKFNLFWKTGVLALLLFLASQTLGDSDTAPTPSPQPQGGGIVKIIKRIAWHLLLDQAIQEPPTAYSSHQPDEPEVRQNENGEAVLNHSEGW